MYKLIIIFVLNSNPNDKMIAISPNYETLEICQNEEKVFKQVKDKGAGILPNSKILDLYCEKLK